MRVTETEIDEQVINSRWITTITFLMIVLGIMAIAFPFFATVALALLFSWIFIFAGIAQIVYAFQSRGAGQVVWKLILGLLYLLSWNFHNGKFARKSSCLHVGVRHYHFCARHHSSVDCVSNAMDFI